MDRQLQMVVGSMKPKNLGDRFVPSRNKEGVNSLSYQGALMSVH